MMKAILALEDGMIFHGESFGATTPSCGEVCFNTSMTGYQEIITDPSYRGQVVTMTYSHIGNYGVNELDVESSRPQIAGLVVREFARVPSNWRSQMSLDEYLKKSGIPGISGVDTRALTTHLRKLGAMRGVITTEMVSESEAVDRARTFRYAGNDFVREVTCSAPYVWDPEGSLSRRWTLVQGTRLEGAPPLTGEDYRQPLPPVRYRIAAYDFGIKYNILRRLRQHGFEIKVFPAMTPASELLKENPDGIFLSNGPGDPEVVTYAHDNVRQLIGKKPLFGICLGHQIIGLALGGKTFKLKFGHRGGNQPVKDLQSGKVNITSQNHGFSVDPGSIPSQSLVMTQVNLNDGTCEGMAHREHPLFSVQYHPEASPGPHDTTYFFELFGKMIESGKPLV